MRLAKRFAHLHNRINFINSFFWWALMTLRAQQVNRNDARSMVSSAIETGFDRWVCHSFFCFILCDACVWQTKQSSKAFDSINLDDFELFFSIIFCFISSLFLLSSFDRCVDFSLPFFFFCEFWTKCGNDLWINILWGDWIECRLAPFLFDCHTNEKKSWKCVELLRLNIVYSTANRDILTRVTAS